MIQLYFPEEANPWRVSTYAEVVNDSTLVNYDNAPESSDVIQWGGAARVELFVTVTPEAGQSVVFSVQTSPDGVTFFDASDANYGAMGVQEYVFNSSGSYAFLLEGVAPYGRIRYGYRGGNGVNASLQVGIMGRKVS